MKGQSEQGFILLYSILAGSFLLFVVILFILSNKVFEGQKTEDVKEGTKIILRAISIMMCLYIFILQIPLVTMILQGFLCDEDPTEVLVLTSIKCDSVTH